MKKVYLFCSRIYVYLTELPVFIMLAIAIAYNDKSEEAFKHYPLIIFLIGAAAFIFLYFFRFISIDSSEIKYLGLFSSKDSAAIAERRTLAISLRKRGKIKLELYGNADEEPIFDWMKANDVMHREICVFRGRAFGGALAVKRIVRFFAEDTEATNECLNGDFEYENENVRINTEKENDSVTLRINFKKTFKKDENENE